MRRPIVAANWKMNGDRDLVRSLIPAIVEADARCDIVICPPATLLGEARLQIGESRLKLGAQNVDWHAAGAYTGEVSTAMLLEQGCQYVIVGHSERRGYFSETNEESAKKFGACVEAGLIPIFCLGESGQQRQAGETEQVIASQLGALFDQVATESLPAGIIAYEPVWAIGTGDTATPEQAAAVHEFIRQQVAERDVNIANDIQILYGGSVNAENAAGLFEMQHIDGALVGGSSLDAEAFNKICCAAAAK